MINMTRQNRAELTALKKQQRALGAEEKTLGRNAMRASGKIEREVRKAMALTARNGARVIVQVARELKVGKKRLAKTGADIAKRIAILQGRLA